jgi:hypothetical protein
MSLKMKNKTKYKIMHEQKQKQKKTKQNTSWKKMEDRSKNRQYRCRRVDKDIYFVI